MGISCRITCVRCHALTCRGLATPAQQPHWIAARYAVAPDSARLEPWPIGGTRSPDGRTCSRTLSLRSPQRFGARVELARAQRSAMLRTAGLTPQRSSVPSTRDGAACGVGSDVVAWRILWHEGVQGLRTAGLDSHGHVEDGIKK